MIPWPPEEETNDPYEVSVWSTATNDLTFTVPVTPEYTQRQEELELEEAARRVEEERRQHAEKVRRRNEQRARQRQGKGHDPRRQVICRSRVQSRGKGRR